MQVIYPFRDARFCARARKMRKFAHLIAFTYKDHPMPPTICRALSDVDFDAFTAAFNRAYSDYFMPVAMTSASFRHLMDRDDLYPDVSVAAMDNGTIIGTGFGIRGQWADRRMGVVPAAAARE
jgi:hypothetical protein